jgi:hypothetical protein
VTTHPVDHGGYVIDSTVAARSIREGEVILRVPEHLVVTLNRWNSVMSVYCRGLGAVCARCGNTNCDEQFVHASQPRRQVHDVDGG